MPNYEITSPDGRRFQITAPEGATQEQILSYAQTHYNNNAPDGVPQQQQKSSILEKLAAPTDAAARGGAQLISNIMAPFAKPETMQKLRDAGLYDVKHPEIENPFVRGVMESPLGAYSQAVYSNGVPGLMAPIVQGAEDLARKAGVSQNALDMVNMAGTIMSVAGPPNPTKKIATIKLPDEARSMLNSGILKNNLGEPTPKNTPLTPSQFGDISGRSYAAAETLGGTLDPNALNHTINKASQVAPQTAAGKAFSGDNPVTQTVKDLQSLKGQKLSLQAMQEIDEDLSARIDARVDKITGAPDKFGYKLQQIQQHLRDTFLDPKNALGNADGVQAWREGQQVWALKMRAGDIQRILNRAESADVPSTAIKNGFKAYTNHLANRRGWTDAQWADLNRAARTGIVTGALKGLGSKLMSGIAGTAAGATGGGAVGGLVGGAVGMGLTYPFRAAADALQKRPATRALESLSNSPVIERATQP